MPDFPIQRLFAHIEPKLVLIKDLDRFEDVSDMVLARLSAGQLAAWGRAWDGTRSFPLEAISATYWLSAKFNIWLMDRESNRHVFQAAAREYHAQDQTQYTEIHVSYAEALSIWPREIPMKSCVGRDTSLDGALASIGRGELPPRFSEKEVIQFAPRALPNEHPNDAGLTISSAAPPLKSQAVGAVQRRDRKRPPSFTRRLLTRLALAMFFLVVVAVVLRFSAGTS